jgi:peroxiredoxin family protein/rhodanese-related sulfurtransferase/TusA-related sulfurtransferase
MLGFIARNHIDGSGKTITWKQISQLKERNAVLLDVRTEDEHELGAIEGSLNIPHTQLRSRLSEIPADRPVVVYCSVGLRGYVAQRLLLQNGFREVVNLTGGYKTWEVVKEEIKQLQGEYMQKEKESTESAAYDYSRKLDACGLQCPGPIIQLKKEVDRMAAGERILVSATDPGFAKDVRSWCNLTGNRLISFTNDSGGIEAIIEKATALSATSGNQQVQVKQNHSATLIVFSNDMDKALASFVLANGAAATGQQVTMFFTFWGLSILRKRNPGKVSKDFMGKMFGMMLPKGMDKLSLSKMNMVGMGPLMMKSRMRSKRVDQLSEMFAQAKASGVRFVACQMSMDIMGIKAEELLDGIEIGGVATYMEAAAVSTVNLFI